MKGTLKKYLTINSAFSAFSATIMFLFPNALNTFFGINNVYVFPFIAANLLMFSLIVCCISNLQLNDKFFVDSISFVNVFWVIGSLIIVLFQLFNLTIHGYILISIIAAWIGFLAYKQFANNKPHKIP